MGKAPRKTFINKEPGTGGPATLVKGSRGNGGAATTNSTPTKLRNPKSEVTSKHWKKIDKADEQVALQIKGAKDAGRQIIKFTLVAEQPYGMLSNMRPGTFQDDTLHYRTLEHYYHSQKFRLGAEAATNPAEKQRLLDIAEKIRKDTKDLRGGVQAKKFAKKNEKHLPAEFLTGRWGSGLRDEVMRKGLRGKFSNFSDTTVKFRETLLGTDDAYIVQWSKDCSHFGWSPETGGDNELGRMLMELRDELRKEDEEAQKDGDDANMVDDNSQKGDAAKKDGPTEDDAPEA